MIHYPLTHGTHIRFNLVGTDVVISGTIMYTDRKENYYAITTNDNTQGHGCDKAHQLLVDVTGNEECSSLNREEYDKYILPYESLTELGYRFLWVEHDDVKEVLGETFILEQLVKELSKEII